MKRAIIWAAMGIFAITPVVAQDYPTKPITMVVPFAAGGGTDGVARAVAAQLQTQFGQPVNVVNRPGASGLLGHQEIAHAAPDGYTIGFASSSVDSYSWLQPGSITYEDFTPLALVNRDYAGLQVRADSEFQTAADAVAAMRERPQDFTASASGVGGPWHLAWLQMLMALDIDPNAIVFVPTGGVAPSLNELIAGGVDFAPTSLVEARGLLEGGEVRSLGVMALERDSLFPDIPTLNEELGIAVDAGVWRGFLAPAGLPEDVRQTLTDAIEDVYNSDAFREQMATLRYGMVWASGEDFKDFMAEQHEITGTLLNATGLAVAQ